MQPCVFLMRLSHISLSRADPAPDVPRNPISVRPKLWTTPSHFGLGVSDPARGLDEDSLIQLAPVTPPRVRIASECSRHARAVSHHSARDAHPHAPGSAARYMTAGQTKKAVEIFVKIGSLDNLIEVARRGALAPISCHIWGVSRGGGRRGVKHFRIRAEAKEEALARRRVNGRFHSIPNRDAKEFPEIKDSGARAGFGSAMARCISSRHAGGDDFRPNPYDRLAKIFVFFLFARFPETPVSVFFLSGGRSEDCAWPGFHPGPALWAALCDMPSGSSVSDRCPAAHPRATRCGCAQW